MGTRKLYVSGVAREEVVSNSNAVLGQTARELPRVVVSYEERPVWEIPYFDEAQVRCSQLNFGHIRVGSHICKFVVEEVSPGKFALACEDHPDTKLPVPSVDW